ncbi:hypothetical protein ACFY2R_02210 [Micromonospora olivasterospora]|uniref:hypothetical protein n=1 Tax=Micromonospora olivasterospora TaxID=1880 RepID=UPI001FEB8E83|nr:hypothetical protein [Micromonospora olivasterospora]
MPTPADNRTAGPGRPLDVTRDELERAVRETFSRQVAVPRPLAADPAGLAIRRATRIRRRRALTGTALAGVATVLISAGMVNISGPAGRPTTQPVVLGDPGGSAGAIAPDPVPAPSAGPSRPVVQSAVDLVVGDVLTTTRNQQIALTGISPVDRAQRVREEGGWLVVGSPGAAGRTLVSVGPDGTTQRLLAGAQAVALAADGRQVAWRDGDQLFVAGVTGGKLIAVTGTPAPGAAVPAGFVGDAVLVRLDPAGPGYALWRPYTGRVTTGGGRDVLAVHGTLPDGRAVGLVSAGTPRRPCLALLDPRDLAATRTACGPALDADGPGAVSADGRWLLANGRAGSSATALLVDLSTLGRTPVARPAGPPLTGAVAWTPAQTAWYADRHGGLVLVRPDRVAAGEAARPTPVTGVAPGTPIVAVTAAIAGGGG